MQLSSFAMHWGLKDLDFFEGLFVPLFQISQLKRTSLISCDFSLSF